METLHTLRGLGAGPAFGPFIKTANHQIVEILALSGLDFAVLDAEHAPYTQTELDRMLAVACARNFPVLVRAPDHSPSFIGMCLDLGASGVLIPRVSSAAEVHDLVAATRFRKGRRGFSPSPRAGRYGTIPAAEQREAADAHLPLWCQIEDIRAVECIDEIAAVPDIGCLLVGPMDLSVSMGAEGPQDVRVADAVKTVALAGRRQGRTTGIAVSHLDDAKSLIALGMTRFVCASDQSMLLNAARQMTWSGRAAITQEGMG